MPENPQTAAMCLRPARMRDDVAFAVSRLHVWDPLRYYAAPVGWRVATTAEGAALFDGSGVGPFVHSGQCGWLQCRWRGKEKHYFRFLDSHRTGAFKHAGSRELDKIGLGDYKCEKFAGMVLVRCKADDKQAGSDGGALAVRPDGSAGEQRAAQLWPRPGTRPQPQLQLALGAGQTGDDIDIDRLAQEMSADDLAAVLTAITDA